MIRGIIETSFLDWDGKVVMVLYTPRCNLKCPFCHNWELMDNPSKYPEKTWEDIKSLLEKYSDFLDGVCVTGGEPLLEPDLEELLQNVKNMGKLVKLDTNGTMPDVLSGLMEKGLVDYIAMDIKMPPDKRYVLATGVKTDLKDIKKSISIIMKSGIDYEFRTTVVPTIHSKVDIVDIAKYLKGAKKYVLQQFAAFHACDENLRELKPYDNEIIAEMAEECEQFVENMVVRGLR
jgi:pyruvate formate lyase activating enzyme